MLYIDPSTQHTLRLWCDGRDATMPYPKAEDMLRTLVEFSEIPEAMQKIVLVNEASSFTTIRTLAAICNALAVSAKTELFVVKSQVEDPSTLDIASLEPQSIIMPQYSGLPNIS